MMSSLPPLEVLDMAMDSLTSFDKETPLRIPRLLEKPQNPILDTLRFWLNHQTMIPLVANGVPHSDFFPRREEIEPQNTQVLKSYADIWSKVLTQARSKSSIMSGDTVRMPPSGSLKRSAFLSEQSGNDVAAGVYYVYPPLQDPLQYRRHISPEELFNALRWTIAGSASALHSWDKMAQSFVIRGPLPSQRVIIAVSGIDEAASNSLMNRFVSIGTLIRRIDLFIQRLRTSPLSPVYHAFVHAISSILAWTMTFLSNSPLLQPEHYLGPSAPALTTTWAFYAELEVDLNELANFCGISSDLSPSLYRLLPTSDADLLSQICDRLQQHAEKRSPPHVTAQFAFMFTITAQTYFEDVCIWVGYPSKSVPSHFARYGDDGTHRRVATFLDDENDDHGSKTDLIEDEKPFPDFLPCGLSQTLNRARRSLVLLRAAQPNHVIFSRASLLPPIRWFWKPQDVQIAFYDQHPAVPIVPITRNGRPLLSSASPPYQDEMQIFEVFDLKPGASISTSMPTHPLGPIYENFLDNCPAELPCLTPTMPDLTRLVLKPLIYHVENLSTALVDLFLSQSSCLYFPSHLRLLRSYLLLTSHAFKSTLQSALFSDAFGDDGAMTTYATHTRSPYANPQRHSAAPRNSQWTIGISSELTPDGSWPPAGASLSFFLRTVIIDSLNLEYRLLDHDIRHDFGEEINSPTQVIEEAEWRLGFAIRDLPVGGDARWLRARSMEAFDFLYMEYKPPDTLAPLITPSILSKYHRIFAFNLRLMRVDNAVRALFRLTRKNSPQVFPTFTASHRLFLHFRFVSEAFVFALSSYVYDTAIKSNFDAFLAELMPSPEGAKRKPRFLDVFALSDYHSSVMDDVLSACLLRSGQKPVGDLLRGGLEIILQFGLLVSDVMTGALEEYQAVDPLEALFKQFLIKVTTLVKVLSALVERGTMAGRFSTEARLPNMNPGVRVNDCLADLLVRIDVTEWWQTRSPKHPSE